MTAIEDREQTIFIDLSRAVSSADALRQLESILQNDTTHLRPGLLVDINTGDLLLTPGVLSKMKVFLKRYGVNIETLYSSVPQTQQSALDEGLLVRRQPLEVRPTNRFMPKEQTISAYDHLDLPFDKKPAPKAKSKSVSEPDPISAITNAALSKVSKSKLSITLDDGTREELIPPQELSTETVYYRQTLRSGQLLEASGNIVVVGDAHSGSEILADGDILVWGFLGGIAHAGRNNNEKAQIRAIRIEAVQLRIADQIARRPDRLFKHTGKGRGPEVAKIKDGEIQIFEDIIER